MHATIRDELLANGYAESYAQAYAEGLAKGITKGKARMLVRLIDVRGFALADDLRDRLVTCEDENLIEMWFDRAVAATSLDEVFDD